MPFISALFHPPKIPSITPPPPPKPVRNTQLEAEESQAGRRQGLIAALFGYKNPAGGSSKGHTLTGQ